MRPSLVIVVPALLVSIVSLAACEKSSSPTGDGHPPNESSRASSSAAVTASAVAAPPSASVSAAATPTDADADAARGTVASAVAAGRPRDGGGAAASAAAAAAAAAKPVSKHVAGSNFTLDVASPGCKVAAECTMTIKLVAAGDYHVNKEYPYKFIATATPSLEFLGKPDATTFTRAAGDFVEQGEKAGTMTIRFKPTAPGDPHVTGTYKFSVCSADQCQIEQEKLDLAIPVL